MLLLGFSLLLSSQSTQATDLTVKAYGEGTKYCIALFICGSVEYPRMSVYVNGTKYGSTTTVTGSATNYTFNVTLPAGDPINIDILYDNDFDSGFGLLDLIAGYRGDRNLFINEVKIEQKTFYPNDSGITKDTGSGYAAATDGVNVSTYGTGLYLDGALRINTTHDVINPPPPVGGIGVKIAEFRMNESGWNGTTNELKDTAGYATGPYHGKAKNDFDSVDPTSQTSNRARPGSPGTCKYARINESLSDVSAFTVSNLPVGLNSGDQTTVAFWMYWDGTNYVMPIGWQYYDLYIANGHFGFNTAYSDIYGISSSGLANGWHHVVAVFTNNNVSQNKLYIDGVKKSLSQRMGSYNNSTAEVKTTMQISGWTANKDFRFRYSKIDEVKVFKGGITQAQVDEIYNETYQCAGETVDLLADVDNLAKNATVTTSYVSPWENLEAVNDGVVATTSYVYHLADPAGIKTYGNWDGSTKGTTHWVSFEWPTAKKLTDFQVFWWDDSFLGAGYVINKPTTASVEYWDGSAWQSLGSIGTTLHQFNSLPINNITTTRVRVLMQSSNATGITEVRIFGTEAPELISQYHLDEESWSGTANEVNDTAGYTGGPFDGQAIGSPLPAAQFTSPAIPGTTSGTCGYAELNGPTSGGGAFSFSSIPFDTNSGDVNSISFWMYWNGTDQVVPLGSNGYELIINSNKLGFTSNGTDLYGVDITGISNSWVHIAATVHQGDYTQNKLYINGSLVPLTQVIANTRVLKTFYDMASYHSGANWEYSSNLPAPWFTDNPNSEVEYGRSDFFGLSGPLRSILELERVPGDPSNLKAYVSTTPGETVYVSFDHADRSGHLDSDFEVYIDNQLIATVDQQSTAFSHYEYSALTTSTNTLVEFKATTTDGWGPVLDDIKIETGSGALFNNQVQAGGQTSSLDKRFTGRMDEIKFYRGEIDQTQVTADYTATHVCPSYVTNVAAGKFNCVAEQESSLNTGHLYMQVAGMPFNIKVAALKADGSAETSFSAASDKNVTLEIIDLQKADSPIVFNDGVDVLAKTLTFTTSNTTGVVQVNNLTINKAYRALKCRVTDANQSPTLSSNSTDKFSVRPMEFTLTSTANADATGTNANASPTIAAGANFTINAITNMPGYNGTPTYDASKINAHAGAPQKGTLTGNFAAAVETTGNAAGTSFNYSEVGYVKINTQGVYDDAYTFNDSSMGDCIVGSYSNVASGGKYGCNFRNNTQSDFFGRFIPYHFNVGGGSRVTTGQCGSNFTYYGQDGLTTQFDIRAENMSGALLRNYDGAYAKLNLNTWTDTSSPTGLRFLATNLPSGVALSSSATATTGSWIQGLGSVTAKHQLSRPSTEVAPVNLIMEMDAIDSDGVGVEGGTPESINQTADSLFHYGRLNLGNANGSEMYALTIPMQAQYWDGTGWVQETLDSCSAIQPVNVTMSNYQQNLNACETILIGGGTMNNGEVSFTLTAPGNGNNGSVNLTPNLSTASGTTCAPIATTAISTNTTWFGATSPSAKISFGQRKTPVIFIRERF